MFIPANFAIGALVGAATAYVYKDESARGMISGLGSKAKQGFSKLRGKSKDVVEEVSDQTVTNSDATESVVEAVEVASDDKSVKA